MLLLSMSAYAEEFPAGLRLPTKQELAKLEIRIYQPGNAAKVIADFNGDEKPDTAFLLANIKNHKVVLAVKLSSENGYDWQIIDEGPDWSSETQMFLQLSEPGKKYYTACGVGLKKCSKNEPKSYTFKNACLWYFPVYKAKPRFFAWNNNKMIFESLDVISDDED